MGIVRSLVRLLVAAFIAAWVAGMIGAFAARRRLAGLPAPDSDEPTIGVTFGPLEYRSTAAALREGRIEIWFGGGAIDLRDATLDPDGAHFDVRVVFGGGTIVVPPDWRVTSYVTGIGAVADTRPRDGLADDAPELVLEGSVMFGGFAVTSELPEERAEALHAYAGPADGGLSS